jgi:hypothetical protein
MKSSSDLDWEFGAIPMIEPEYLGGILATSSDIALLIDQNATVHSILLNSSEKSVGICHIGKAVILTTSSRLKANQNCSVPLIGLKMARQFFTALS